MSTTTQDMAPSLPVARADDASMVDGAAAAFGYAAAITIVFNTLLAWVKDAYAPLNTYMASLTGHHWKTHGLADVILFLVLGFFFMARGSRVSGGSLSLTLVAASVVGGAGLGLWFLMV